MGSRLISSHESRHCFLLPWYMEIAEFFEFGVTRSAGRAWGGVACTESGEREKRSSLAFSFWECSTPGGKHGPP